MDLCTLGQVKQYLGPPVAVSTVSDAVFAALIKSYSALVERYCGRSFASGPQTDIRNGVGGYRVMLRQWPVTAIASVAVDGQSIGNAGSITGAGYRNVDAAESGDGRMILLQGYRFSAGFGNVLINYTAGYTPTRVPNEAWNIPGGAPFTLTLQQSVAYIGNDSIALTAGGTLTRVAGNPAAGQYAITAAGAVTFNAADAGKGVLISYDTIGVPVDLSEAVIELVALRYRSRDWIGYNSKALNGETSSFVNQHMPPTIKAALAPFQSTLQPA